MSLTIIMYHYVRDLAASRFPDIKARTLDQFKIQISYLEDNYNIVTAEQVISAIVNKTQLPNNAAWLTFDDGYIDHFTNVFPMLFDRGLQGTFFPISSTTLQREILDVNKIHFILAAQPDVEKVILEIKRSLAKFDNRDDVSDFQTYWKGLAHASRFDSGDVIFVKRILQHALPEDIRNMITTELFHRFVTADMEDFSAGLYMSVKQLKTMIDAGMYIGSHGAQHYWMDKLSPAQQLIEIDQSLDFLQKVGASLNNWIMCYPYGSYNHHTQTLLAKRGCAAALTTRVAVANIGDDHPLALPRLDTNDIRF